MDKETAMRIKKELDGYDKTIKELKEVRTVIRTVKVDLVPWRTFIENGLDHAMSYLTKEIAAQEQARWQTIARVTEKHLLDLIQESLQEKNEKGSNDTPG